MSKLEVFLDIKEVRKPEVDAQLVADNIASQLEKRISFRGKEYSPYKENCDYFARYILQVEY